MNKLNYEIVDQLKKGDQKTFEHVFHSYYGKLLYYANEYVINKEIAREFVQETFLKLWEIRDNLADNTNLEALLFTIIRNDCLNYLKKATAKKRYNEFTQKNFSELQMNYIALKDDLSGQLFYDELRNKINYAIDHLPEKCREIFELSRNSEMKYKDIAEKLNLSIKTVENQISEALKRIRNEIKGYV